MKRIIYHGGKEIIKEPKFGFGNIHNDYGLGFYCTTNNVLAREWAARMTGKGYVSEYVIRDDRLKILDLTKAPYDNIMYWIALLLHNREISSRLVDDYPRELKYLEYNYLIDVTNYDIVIGYRADDSYFHFPVAFVRSEITLESLMKVFMAGELGKQYVLISKRAFSLVKFMGCYEVGETYKQDYYSRKSNADKLFSELLKNDRYFRGTRLRDLVINNE